VTLCGGHRFSHLPYNHNECLPIVCVCVCVCVCVHARTRVQIQKGFQHAFPCSSRFLFLIKNFPNTVLNFTAILKFLDVTPYDLVNEPPLHICHPIVLYIFNKRNKLLSAQLADVFFNVACFNLKDTSCLLYS
jgi:hypothetical protein